MHEAEKGITGTNVTRSADVISEELVNQLASIEIEYDYILPSQLTDAMLGNIEALHKLASNQSREDDNTRDSSRAGRPIPFA